MNLDTMNPECFITSEHRGLIEMCYDLGAQIREGDLLAVIHEPDRTGTAPVEYRSKVDGLFMSRHFLSLIRPGDFLAVVAATVD